MDRRQFLISLAAASVATPALAAVGKSYKKGLIEAELAAGKTVFVDFYADWCTTCRVQASKMRKLIKQNPDYEKHITFVKVDWDRHSSSSIARKLNIPRRSTLVALKGDKELGRIVAGTSTDAIKSLMDKALAASKAA